MSESAGRQNTTLIREVFGKNRFDDRVDTQPDITSGEAVILIGRCVKMIAEVRGLFLAKFLLRLGLIFPGLLLPWLAKIVIDNAILQEPFGNTDVLYPPFIDPILALVEGRDPVGIMMVITIIYFGMMVVMGFRAGKTGAGLLQGPDAATHAENAISSGYSEGGGIWGIAEFMVHVRLTQTIANRLRSRLFDRLTHLPMTVLDDQRIGDSVFRVLYDAPAAPDLAYRLTLEPFFMLFGFILNLWILQYSYGNVSPELILVAWAAVPVAFLLTYPFSGALRRTNQNKRAAGSATTNSMEESMAQVSAVQSLGASAQQRKRFAERSEQAFLRERYALAAMIAAGMFIGAAFGIAGIYVTILVTDRIIEGSMSAGDFAVLMGIFYGIAVPAAFFGALWIKLQETIAAVRRVFFFLDYESEEDRTGGVELDDIVEGIVFDGVTFNYPDGHQALHDVDLKLQIGELVALVGPTGAGKTTLAYMIPSLLVPTTGRVLVDGIDIADIDIDSLRRTVTYVFQEHILLSESIRDNLLLANPAATENDMMIALKTAGCLDFIDRLPDGIDTVLGRAGDTLSVGQQQRLSIARGLVREAKVLILDEPTAALDPHTENHLVSSLQAASKDRLIVVIAHRLSTIRKADLIVFLEDGELRDIGTHGQLMAAPDSDYRRFVELQNA